MGSQEPKLRYSIVPLESAQRERPTGKERMLGGYKPNGAGNPTSRWPIRLSYDHSIRGKIGQYVQEGDSGNGESAFTCDPQHLSTRRSGIINLLGLVHGSRWHKCRTASPYVLLPSRGIHRGTPLTVNVHPDNKLLPPWLLPRMCLSSLCILHMRVYHMPLSVSIEFFSSDHLPAVFTYSITRPSLAAASKYKFSFLSFLLLPSSSSADKSATTP